MPHPSWLLALAQMKVEGGQPSANLERATRQVADAARQGAKLVLLPEALDCGWTHPCARTSAGAIPDGQACQTLADAARRSKVHLCAGLVEQTGQGLFNSAVLLAPDGRVLLHHRKLNELELAHDLYRPGDRLGVVDTPLGRLGLMICADAFARGQILTRSLAWMGADLILSPSAWAVPADHDNRAEPYGQLWLDNYQPVAREHRLWIASVSNVGPLTAGPWTGRACIGCSMVINPEGRRVLQGPYGADAETLLLTEITVVPRPAHGDSWNAWLKSSSG